ncbi:hypothetical protein [Pedobacter steynii]
MEWSKDSEIPTIEDSHIVISNLPLPIKLIKAKNFDAIYDVLANLKQRLPIKILRKCKNAVYDLIKTNKSVNTVYIGDLDNVDVDKEIEFVMGVGVASQYSENGYIGISNNDIFEDIVLDSKPWDCGKVIYDVLPKLYKGNIYLPIYKYLRQNGDLNDRGKLFKSANYTQKIIDAVGKNTIKTYYPYGKTYLNKRDEISKLNSINEVIGKYEFKFTIKYIVFLKHENIDLDVFKKFLSENLAANITNTDFRKLICYYDYLKNGLQIDLLVEA